MLKSNRLFRPCVVACQTPHTAELDHHTNPKTLWFAWCPSGEAAEIESCLADLAAQDPAAEAGASIDWHKQLKVRVVMKAPVGANCVPPASS